MKLIAALLLILLQATLTVRTVLVALPVTVTDRKGGRVTGLVQDDFRLYEDGKLQQVTLFQQGAGAITLGLIVDHSGSMRDNLPSVIAALTAFAAVTQPDDEMFVVGFNERVWQPLAGPGPRFTNDPRAIAAAIATRPAQGRTALYDGMLVGLDQVVLGHSDKRTLIVVSDGDDNASQHPYAEVQALALQSDVVIYAIGLRGTSDEQSPKVLKRLAEDTGGVAYFPQSPQEVSRVLSEIVRDLRQQYTLGFSSDATDGGFHRLSVTAAAASDRSLRVRTRAGYQAPGESK